MADKIRLIYKNIPEEDCSFNYTYESLKDKLSGTRGIRFVQIGPKSNHTYSIEIESHIPKTIFENIILNYSTLPKEIHSTNPLDSQKNILFIEKQLKEYGLIPSNSKINQESRISAIEKILLERNIEYKKQKNTISFLKNNNETSMKYSLN